MDTIENEKLDTKCSATEPSTYQFPSLDLVKDQEQNNGFITQDEINENKNRILDTLKMLKIKVSGIKVTVGSTVSLYEIIPGEGVRLLTLKHWERKIILTLATHGARMITPVIGRATVGIEIPNKHPQTVTIRTNLNPRIFKNAVISSQ